MFKRFYSTLKKSPIHITQSAITKMNNIYNNTNNKHFLFSAKNGGCNGFSYDFKSINNEEYNKLCEEYKKIKIRPINVKENVNIIIDPLSEMYLLGTKIDYIEENYKKNIFESKFIFKPNKDMAHTCGCGISFTPKLKNKTKK